MTPIRQRGDGSVTDKLQSLDFLIDEVRELAFSHPNPKEVISKLLDGAKKFIELSESLSELIPENMKIAIPMEVHGTADSLFIRNRRRFQEEHVNPAIQQQLAGTLYQIRRARDRIFSDEDLFGDPAWDILLDLVYAERDNKSVSVTSACMASSVPPTTALRWVTILENKGYIERRQDQLDGRRRYVMLTDRGRVLMNRFFAQLVGRQLM